MLWHGRFEAEPADELLAFTVSLSVDRRLAPDDIAGSRAHARGLARIGILTDAERDEVLAALDQVEHELSEGSFRFLPTDEDIHTAVERRATELAPAAAKLHTGRSRNDQVATDLRLYTKRALAAVAQRIVALQEVLLDRAIEAGDAYLPGYTHLQRAQPVTLAHHLLAHGWALARDVDRLLDARRSGRCLAPRAPGRWRVRRSHSTPTAWPRTSASRHGSRTASTRCRTATSSPSRCSPSPWSGCTCRASARSSCSGHRTSSASPRSTMRSRPAAR